MAVRNRALLSTIVGNSVGGIVRAVEWTDVEFIKGVMFGTRVDMFVGVLGKAVVGDGVGNTVGDTLGIVVGILVSETEGNGVG